MLLRNGYGPLLIEDEVNFADNDFVAPNAAGLLLARSRTVEPRLGLRFVGVVRTLNAIDKRGVGL